MSTPATNNSALLDTRGVSPSLGWQTAVQRGMRAVVPFRTRRRQRGHDHACRGTDDHNTTQRQTWQERRRELEETRRRLLRQLQELEALERRLQRAEQTRRQVNAEQVKKSFPRGEEVTNPTKLESPTCPICLNDYTMGDCYVQGANCQHNFHAHCICSALYRNLACPMCRQDFLPENAVCQDI